MGGGELRLPLVITLGLQIVPSLQASACAQSVPLAAIASAGRLVAVPGAAAASRAAGRATNFLPPDAAHPQWPLGRQHIATLTVSQRMTTGVAAFDTAPGAG